MKFKYLISTMVLLAGCSSVATTSVETDDLMRKQIVGTWRGSYKWQDQTHSDSWIRASSQDRYTAHGSVTGAIDYVFPNREERLTYKASWDIESGYLLVEITESSGGYLIPGIQTKDKILSLSDTTMEVQAEDGSIIILRKQK